MAAQLVKESEFIENQIAGAVLNVNQNSAKTSLITESETAGSDNLDMELVEYMEDEDAACFQDIEMLLELNSGITKVDVEKLKQAGIMTVRGVQTALQRLEISGLGADKVKKLREACLKLTAPVQGVMQDGFLTAKELCEQRKNIFKISTGSKNLDELLGGGIEAASITEIFGEAASGKTQLCHTLCVTAQIPVNNNRGGRSYPGGKVIFIDTENTFRPERLNAIADRFDLDKAKVLENILYARALNSLHQYDLLNGAVSRLHSDPGVYKLLIVDSIVALFRADYASGNSTGGVLSHRQQRLYRMMTRLQEIAEEYNIAVLVTNHVTSDLSSGGTSPGMSFAEATLKDLGGIQYKPAGGNALAHASTTRVCLRRIGHTGIRRGKVYGSPELQEAEAEFVVGLGGVEDTHKTEEELI